MRACGDNHLEFRNFTYLLYLTNRNFTYLLAFFFTCLHTCLTKLTCKQSIHSTLRTYYMWNHLAYTQHTPLKHRILLAFFFTCLHTCLIELTCKHSIYSTLRTYDMWNHLAYTQHTALKHHILHLIHYVKSKIIMPLHLKHAISIPTQTQTVHVLTSSYL